MQFSYTFCYCEENVLRFCEAVATAHADPAQRALLPPLLQRIENTLSDMFAMFMSTLNVPEDNERIDCFSPSCICFCAGPIGSDASPGAPKNVPNFVMWDYHVVALLRVRNEQESTEYEWFVVDFDTKWPPNSTTCSPLGTYNRGGGSAEKMTTHELVAWPLKQYVIMSLFPRTVPGAANGYNVAMLEAINADQLGLRVVPARAYLASFRSDRSHMLKNSKSGRKPVFQQPPPPHDAPQSPSPVVDIAADAAARVAAEVGNALARRSALGTTTNLVCFVNVGGRKELGVGDVVLSRNQLVKGELDVVFKL